MKWSFEVVGIAVAVAVAVAVVVAVAVTVVVAVSNSEGDGRGKGGGKAGRRSCVSTPSLRHSKSLHLGEFAYAFDVNGGVSNIECNPMKHISDETLSYGIITLGHHTAIASTKH